MEERHATVNGLSMRWLEFGSGFPVVLLHGAPTSPVLWRKVMPRLSGVRALAWQLVGYGRASGDAPAQSIGLTSQSDYLVRWLRMLGIEEAVLAGHDLGGGIAQIVAARHPELCAGLFLTNCVTRDNWPISEVRLLRSVSPLSRRLPRWVIRQMFRVLMLRGHDTPDLAREAFEIHWPGYAEASRGAAHAMLEQACSLDARDTLAVAGNLPRLNIPSRVVWGDADPWLDLRWGEGLARDLNAPLRVLPHARHFTPEDHPEVLAEEINRLISELRNRM